MLRWRMRNNYVPRLGEFQDSFFSYVHNITYLLIGAVEVVNGKDVYRDGLDAEG